MCLATFGGMPASNIRQEYSYKMFCNEKNEQEEDY